MSGFKREGAAPEIIDSYHRLARTPTGKDPIGEGQWELKKYSPSKTELLLEEICCSFNTRLEQAYINPFNGTKLVRLGRPVVITHKRTSERKLLAFQITRFSPFLNYGTKIAEFNSEVTHRDKRFNKYQDYGRILNEIENKIKEGNHGEWNPFREVTDSTFIPDVPIHRWPKTIYFSVFDVSGDSQLIQPEIEPFLIHEVGSFEDKPPVIHIRFYIEPYFARMNTSREDTIDIFDTLSFSFPRVESEHYSAVSSALKLQPLDKIIDTIDLRGDNYQRDLYVKNLLNVQGVSYRIPSTIPRPLIMGFIQSYLRNFCLGTTL